MEFGLRGRYLARIGFMYSVVSSWDRLRKEQDSSSERTVIEDEVSICPRNLSTSRLISSIMELALVIVKRHIRTLQPIDRPRLELLQRNLRRGRYFVEIEPVIIVLLRELCFCELPFLGVDVGAPFWVHARVFDAHGEERWRGIRICVFRVPPLDVRRFSSCCAEVKL